MAYLGMGYKGEQPQFLKAQVDKHFSWLKGDRIPKFFGDNFLVLYDSNTAREFAKKCIAEAEDESIVLYPMQRPVQYKG